MSLEKGKFLFVTISGEILKLDNVADSTITLEKRICNKESSNISWRLCEAVDRVVIIKKGEIESAEKIESTESVSIT